MSQVFLILAHKNPSQLKRLVEKLADSESKFVLHIDARCNIDDFKNCFNNTSCNVFFTTDRVQIKWGTFQMIEATLNGLKFISENLLDTKRITLLSGQDYPIKPIKQILSFFKNNNNIYIEYSPVPYKHWWQGGLNRFPLYNEISQMIKIYGGSQWWSIPFEVIKKILEELDEYPDFTEYFKRVGIPDESFFQTLLLNIEDEKIGQKLNNNSLRLVSWRPPYLHPDTFRTSDLRKLVKSDKFFARKFDDKFDDEILDKIDDILLNSKKAKIYKKAAKSRDIQYSQAILMLSNNIASFQRFNNLKKDLEKSFKPFLLFHETDGNKFDKDPVEDYFAFDDSILNSLGFKPIENSLLPGSNHFPLFSFFHSHPNFDYYWLIEDDVFFNGDWNTLFEAFNPQIIDSDFISSHIRRYAENPNWYWWDTLKKVPEDNNELITEKIASFNPIYRISREAIIYLEKKMKDGWIGHHETLITTLLYNAGYSILDFGGNGQFCYNKRKNIFYKYNICSVGSRIQHSTMRYRPLITKEEISENILYHPVKIGCFLNDILVSTYETEF